MTSPNEIGSAIGLTTIPRAVLSVAAGVMHSVELAVVGPARIRTSRSNAWEAICADRDRARQRDEAHRVVAALAASTSGNSPAPAAAVVGPAAPAPAAAPSGGRRQRTVGSSPRSSASHASRVPTGPRSAASLALAPRRS